MTSADAGDPEHTTADVHDTVAALSGVSLLGIGAPMAGKDRFAERVVRRADAENRDALHVAAVRGHDRLAASLPDGTALVDCSPSPGPSTAGVAEVSSPADLTGIGMAVSRFLEDAGPRPVVTLDSVSTLLMYSEESAVFRFLAVLTARLRRTGGLGLVLVDRGCHDRQTLGTFQQLFDGRADLEPDRARVRGVDDVSPGWVSR